MNDSQTLAFYRKEAPFYVLSGRQGPHRELDAFLDRLAPKAHILELGCGCGRDAAHMADREFRIDATDGCAAMVRKARERTGLPVRTMRFDELEAADAYDAVWAHASLLHVPRADLGELLERIWHALHPGGLHFANFKAGAQDHDAEGRDRFGRFYNYPTHDWLLKAYRNAGWDIVESRTSPGSGYDGEAAEWIAVVARRPICPICPI